MVKKIKNSDMTEAKNSKVAVIDFSAVWCGPCKMLEPVLEELSEEMAEQITFFSADVDNNMELAQQFRIMNIPALVVLKDGEQVGMTVGFQPKEELKNYLDQYC
ncbi:MAG: thioredoxin [Eubacteriales bacterium]|nr:thioredoxin [Eubacteriales bacterium]